jgi:hypothetical protein
MQNTLRSPFRLVAVALLVMAASAFTATAAHAVTLDVPFAFAVGNKVCPAGHYTVRADDLRSSVELVGVSNGFKWVIHPGDAGPTDNRVILNFVDVGSQHLLRSIQYGPMTTSRIDKKTRELIAAQNGTAITATMGQ